LDFLERHAQFEAHPVAAKVDVGFRFQIVWQRSAQQLHAEPAPLGHGRIHLHITFLPDQRQQALGGKLIDPPGDRNAAVAPVKRTMLPS